MRDQNAVGLLQIVFKAEPASFEEDTMSPGANGQKTLSGGGLNGHSGFERQEGAVHSRNESGKPLEMEVSSLPVREPDFNHARLGAMLQKSSPLFLSVGSAPRRRDVADARPDNLLPGTA